jgi:hypothetical protein
MPGHICLEPKKLLARIVWCRTLFQSPGRDHQGDDAALVDEPSGCFRSTEGAKQGG